MKPKKKGDFALLLEPEEKPESPLGEEADLEEDPEADPLAALDEESELEEEDPLASEEPSDIDPEQAALCRTLGFTDPEQQQALLDLIDLRMSGPAGSTEETLPPLPESAY